jgi:MFS superfamily sulfate permease-like transporter
VSKLRPPGVVLLGSLRGYRRAWLSADLIAAIALLVIAVPEQLATARLAGMPPVTGWYAFVAGTAMFALLGSSRQLSIGADSTIAPLFAVGIGRLAAAGSHHYVELVAILSVEVGVLVALVWLLRLGWIAEFLSAPIITGFLAGVAVIIVVHQLPDLFGVTGGGGSTIHRVSTVISHLGHVNGWTLAIAAAVFAIAVAAERINRKIPGALIGLVGSTLLVGAASLRAHGVQVLGAIAHGAPHLGLGGLSGTTIGQVAPIAAVVALVVVSQTAATTRAFAEQGGYEVDVGRDLLGAGAGSVLAGLAGSFPVNASPGRTGAVASATGRSQAAGLMAAAAIVVLIPAAGVLKDLPLATLAGVLVFVATRIFHVGDLRAILRFDRFEFALALVTLLAVALVGVEQGIGVAVGLAILDRTRVSAQAHVHVLGRIPGTTSWAPLGSPDAPVPVDGVLVLLFATPLWYANANHFRAEVQRALDAAKSPLHAIVLDAFGMSDIDYTGQNELRRLLDEFDRRGIRFAIARAGETVHDNLARAGLLARIGEERLYESADAAVAGMSGSA